MAQGERGDGRVSPVELSAGDVDDRPLSLQPRAKLLLEGHSIRTACIVERGTAAGEESRVDDASTVGFRSELVRALFSPRAVDGELRFAEPAHDRTGGEDGWCHAD